MMNLLCFIPVIPRTSLFMQITSPEYEISVKTAALFCIDQQIPI